MRRFGDIPSGIYTGLIIDRSSEVPAVASDLFYTVSINYEGGAVDVPGVAPQESARWTSYMPIDDNGEPPDLYPFPLGHRVPIHVERQGDTLRFWIDRGEIPTFGGCPQ